MRLNVSDIDRATILDSVQDMRNNHAEAYAVSGNEAAKELRDFYRALYRKVSNGESLDNSDIADIVFCLDSSAVNCDELDLDGAASEYRATIGNVLAVSV